MANIKPGKNNKIYQTSLNLKYIGDRRYDFLAGAQLEKDYINNKIKQKNV